MVCLLLCRRNLEELLPRFGYDKDITAKDEFIHLVSDSGNQPVPTAAFVWVASSFATHQPETRLCQLLFARQTKQPT